MLPGPVFTFELLTTARRGRFYLMRAFYAAVLFVILWSVYSVWTADTGTELPSIMVRWFALSTYGGITIGQEILVLFLTPALVATAITDEKQRKTLHYLLASRLTSPEIVLGKLGVRMLYMSVLIGVSLPILSLMVLMGGIDPRLVLLAFGATFSTAWFLAALSIWVSTISRRVREALFVAYGLEALWFFSPLIFRNLPYLGWMPVDQAVHWLRDWIGPSSPLAVAISLFFSAVAGGGPRGSELELIGWMAGLQTAFGVVLAALASWQLRPIFRRQDGGSEIRALKGLRSFFLRRRRFRLWRRPAVSDRPMMWKELQTGGPRGLARWVAFLLTVVGGGFLAYYFVWYAMNAVSEMWEFGYQGTAGPNSTFRTFRWQLQSFLYFAVPMCYLLAILGVAGAGAAAITSEHEDDTWLSLTATDLTAREIVFAKLAGALARGRRFAEFILFMVVTGAIAGSIHPLSIPLEAVALLTYGWFAAALGVWLSLNLRSTWRAQVLTLSCLFLLNIAGQVFLNLTSRFGFAPQVWPGFTPSEVGKLLLSIDYFDRLRESSWPDFWWRVSSIDNGLPWRVILGAVSVLGYAAFAALVTWHSIRMLEIVAGRASRTREAMPEELSKTEYLSAANDARQPAEVVGH
jgi:ABC-type transport system involved in multi-copper enzyme maturation permease subunit